MSLSFYADMHCHPQGRSFNYFRNNPQAIGQVSHNFPKEWSPWVLPGRDNTDKNWSRQLKGKRPGYFSQSDFNRLAVGKVRLVFASLYPLEKGFVTGKTARGFWQLVHGLLKPISFLSENNAIRTLAQSLQMRYPAGRIRFFQGKTTEVFDYWKEAKAEYYFLAARDGVQQLHTFEYVTHACEVSSEDNTQQGRNHNQINTFQINHRYEIVQSKDHLEELISNKRDSSIAVVLTIEGGHILSVNSSNELLTWPAIHKRLLELKNWGRKKTDSFATAAELKNIDSLTAWIHNATGEYLHNPVFLLNLSHHFNNHLASHARSLPDKLRLLMDQSEGMHTADPISEIGCNVITCCLNIKRTEDSRGVVMEDDFQGNRILIDVKHMNPAARAVYYNNYIIPYNTQNPKKRIPVVATHVGVVGSDYESLEQLIQQELDCFATDIVKPNTSKSSFTCWGINLCLEDIKVIIQSCGIVALSLDQRILGNPSGKSSAEDFVRNLYYIISEAKKHAYLSEQTGHSVWDCVAIASDFDGFIDPIDDCPSAVCFEELYGLIKLHLSNEPKSFFEPYNIDVCLEKLFGLNSYTFTKKYFPR